MPYVPTLPDPYAANLGALQAQFERVAGLTAQGRAGVTVWLWLVARTQWQPLSTTQTRSACRSTCALAGNPSRHCGRACGRGRRGCAGACTAGNRRGEQ
jgi:hypothetical protein